MTAGKSVASPIADFWSSVEELQAARETRRTSKMSRDERIRRSVPVLEIHH